MSEILELKDKNKIIGHIYKITCIINNKNYIGQTVSHRKNKGKYRPFGYVSRFKDHISEAINNTKKKQCTYLNNSIRKYGKDSFVVELIETCPVDDLNNKEIYYIDKYKTLYPNGYNLTNGGKTARFVKILNNDKLNIAKKRGREFGYIHNDSTKKKMSDKLKQLCSSDVCKIRMRNTMTNFYDNNKIKILKKYNLDNNIEKYIKPVKNKLTGLVHDYIINVNKRKLTLHCKNETLEQKYLRLKNILEIAKSKNC